MLLKTRIHKLCCLTDTDVIFKSWYYIVKLGFRSKVYLRSLRDLDLELVAIIAMSPPPAVPCIYLAVPIKLFGSELH